MLDHAVDQAEVPDVQPGVIRAPGKTLTLPPFNGTSASGALDRHDDRRGTTRALDLPPGASDVPRKVMRAAKHHIQRAIEIARLAEAAPTVYIMCPQQQSAEARRTHGHNEHMPYGHEA